jgi:excisionase family DNA binding protein
MEDRLLTSAEVARILGVPQATLRQWRWRGVGPRGIRVGRHIRYRRSDVDRWVEDQADPMPDPRAGTGNRGRR